MKDLLIVDECPDANGHATIRWQDSDGEPDIERQPVATAYSWHDAQGIVDAWNACQLRTA